MSRRHRARIQKRLRIIILSCLITALIGEICFFQLAPQGAVPSGTTASIGFPEIAAPETFTSYASVVTADPFAESRQPSAKVLARMSTPPPEEASSLRVIAIVTSGANRLALVELPGTGQPQHVRIGDLIGPHRVTAIGPDGITIDYNGLAETFNISHKLETEALASSQVASVGPSTPSLSGAGPADGEALYKAFLAARMSDVADPPPPIPSPSAGRH